MDVLESGFQSLVTQVKTESRETLVKNYQSYTRNPLELFKPGSHIDFGRVYASPNVCGCGCVL